ncbi:neuronal acetylcholine receptor subunit alpha-9-like [Mya arenaria]|uniref:neuronal acetylcholine receptor subunit alpha-9-like n=1 Tax=Mya arenaria TaxID=6604 RepID=UPI0022DEC4CC|nr:neuronal acetylcholine receptor subunit alpha-9-like [Mya arenaria]
MAGIEASCLVNVANFPFDIQTCDVNIAVWGYDETEVTLHPVIKNDKGADYIQSSTWSLKNISIQGKNSATNTPFVQVTLLIQRHYEYYLLNVIMPPTLLSVLDPCVFILPASSGERMSFAVTCFLAFSVFMTLLGDNLPKSSVPVAHVAYFMMYMLIHSCAVTFCTIITLRVYKKMDMDERIPDWVKFIVRLLRLRFCRYRKQTLKSNVVGPKLDGNLPKAAVNNSVKGEKHFFELIDSKELPNGVVNEKSHSELNEKKLPSHNLWPKTSPNEPTITWNTVGRTLDAFFFTVFLAWLFFIIMSSLISLQLI